MKITISEIAKEYSRKSSFQKWCNRLKDQARELAYNNRPIISKRELEEELDSFDFIPQIYHRIKILRSKSTMYDAEIKVDKRGYLDVTLFFPIEDKEFEKAFYSWKEKRKTDPQNVICYRLDEEVYQVCNKRIERVFNDLKYNAYGSFGKVGTNNNLRCVKWAKC